MPGAVEMYWAALALIGGDPAGRHRRGPSGPSTPTVGGDDLVTGAAAALSGLASWTTGDLAAAHASYRDLPARR